MKIVLTGSPQRIGHTIDAPLTDILQRRVYEPFSSAITR